MSLGMRGWCFVPAAFGREDGWGGGGCIRCTVKIIREDEKEEEKKLASSRVNTDVSIDAATIKGIFNR